MKKLASAIFLLFVLYGTASPQSSCLPVGITFTTQEQIDNFQTNHPGCTEIEGDVTIDGWWTITNIYGLNVLTAIGGDLKINNNYILTSLTGLDNVTSIGENFWIQNNGFLTSLSGLGNVIFIGGDLYIWGIDHLTSLSGRDNVTSIGGLLRIRSNDDLKRLTGLNTVTSIGGGLEIETSPALTGFTGLDNVKSIGGELSIIGNGTLTSLTELDNVTSIGGGLYIRYNPVLTSLTGLDNIDAASIDGLFLRNNTSLSTCEVQSICDYLISPNGTIEIHDNATGCNSQEEVEEACAVSVERIHPEEGISIYPNPANRQLTISSKDGTTIEEVIIYNQIGQKVLLEKPANNIIDISELQPGMYIIEVLSGQRKVRGKLVIE